MAIRFFSDGVSFQPEGKRKITQWLKQVAAGEEKKIGNLCYIFVSDEILLDINRKYLQHDYYTDIITFDDSDGDAISGEMYISIDTVKSNARDYHADFHNELLRVMVHGVLHLCGHKDKTAGEQQEMRAAEAKYMEWFIAARSSMH
ncbi:MAG: rRNA maturation RNase YbeY [Bacteroidales bacterium]|nr:rRNA maturation RNase YbeY [Bacteroidales bacterium]